MNGTDVPSSRGGDGLLGEGRADQEARTRKQPSHCLEGSDAGLKLLFADSDPSAEPVGKPCLVDIVRGHSEDGRLSFVDVRGVRIPDDIVQIEEEHEDAQLALLLPSGSG